MFAGTFLDSISHTTADSHLSLLMLIIGRAILLDETINFPIIPKPLVPGTQGTIQGTN